MADNANLTDAYNEKCRKYDTQAVCDWCRLNRPSLDVSCVVLFGALVFNWRGAMAAQSANLVVPADITGNNREVVCRGR